MRRVGGGSEGAVSEDDDVTSCLMTSLPVMTFVTFVTFVTFRGRSLLLGIVHYSTTWSYKQARTCLIGQN